MQQSPLNTSTETFESSRKKILQALIGARDITFIRSVGNMGDALIYAGARQLLADLSYREIHIKDINSAGGHTAVVAGGGDWCHAYHHYIPPALPTIEERFEQVIILPTSFDVTNDLVRNTLTRTNALVFAREQASYEQIRGLCRAEIAHDCAFYFDFRPYHRQGRGLLRTFRTDEEANDLHAVPNDNNDISETCESLDEWLSIIARYEAVETDRAHVMIAAAMLGKRVTYYLSNYHKVAAIASFSLRGFPVQMGSDRAPLPPPVEANGATTPEQVMDRKQTRGLMRTLILNLPERELHYLLSHRLELLDWGCRTGDGVDVLSQTFPMSSVTGMDDSYSTIVRAQEAFPAGEFLYSSDGTILRPWDIIITVNSLGQHARPLDVVEAHLSHCNKLYIATVPYDEQPFIGRHVAQFREESFPIQIGNFTRLFCATVDVSPIYAQSQQLIVVYGSPTYLEEWATVSLDATMWNTNANLREGLLREEVSQSYRQLALMQHSTEDLQDLARYHDDAIATLHSQLDYQVTIAAEKDRALVEKDRALISLKLRMQSYQEKARQQTTKIEKLQTTSHSLQETINALNGEDENLRNQLNVVYNTRAWKFTYRVWSLRSQGIKGRFKILLLFLSLPLLLIKVMLHKLYHLLVPKPLRLVLWNWRWRMAHRKEIQAARSVSTVTQPTAQQMNWYEYAFDIYKRARNAIAPSSLVNLHVPYEPGMVSIVLPVYNGADRVRESLDSILMQTYRHFEVIAIDDGSTDATGAIMEEYSRRDPRIHVIRQENRKLPRTLSRGFRAARGEFLTWTSDDNHMKPDFLKKLVDSLQRHPKWDMIYANIDIIGEDGKPLRQSDWYKGYQHPAGSEHVYLPLNPSELNIWPNNYVGSAFMYRARVAMLLGDYSFMRFALEDYDYWMRVNDLLNLKHSDFNEPIYEYRLHSKSLTAREKELKILENRKHLMVFDNFRRDFCLTPMIWFFDQSSGDSTLRETADKLKRLLAGKGHLCYDIGDFAAETLPHLFLSIVYVHFSTDPHMPFNASRDIPTSALHVLLTNSDTSLPTEMSPDWDMCIVIGETVNPIRLKVEYQGWFVVNDLATFFSAVDIRARSHHLARVEQEIANPPSPIYQASIVICTYRRHVQMLQAVASIAQQTFDPTQFEVVIVNNDPENVVLSSSIEDVRRQYFADRPDQLRLVQCPVPGLSIARNAGTAEARGEILLFLDDDALADTQWLQHIWNAFRDHPDVGVIGGPIQLKIPTPRPNLLVPGFEGYWSQYLSEYSQFTIVQDWWQYPWGANWCARRSVLLEIGAFRTQKGRVGKNFDGNEEVAAAAWATQLGYKIGIEPRAFVIHNIDQSRFNLEHVEKTILAGILAQYQMQKDMLLPFDSSIEHTQAILADLTPDSGLSDFPIAQQREFEFRKKAYRVLLEHQIKDNEARSLIPIVMQE